jgi:predicted RNase H-like nuclease
MSGYPLLTRVLKTPGVIEVATDPALIELTGAEHRLKYKAMQARWYWGWATPAQRYDLLRWEWGRILALLEQDISGIETVLSMPDHRSRTGERKAFDNRLDAVICAWVAMCALEGRAAPLGDDMSAIWIPARRR